MYELKFDKKVIDFLNKLEISERKRIWSKLQQCKLNPYHFLEHLEDMSGFKLRVEDYRLIIDMDNVKKIMHILKSGHRKNIYDK